MVSVGGVSMSTGSSNDRDRRRQTGQIAQAYRVAHESASAAASLGLMTYGGYWLDQRFGWRPLLTICGACLGFLIAGMSLRQLLRRLDREDLKRRQKASGEDRQKASGEEEIRSR